jgi:hypothetical protein
MSGNIIYRTCHFVQVRNNVKLIHQCFNMVVMEPKALLRFNCMN